MRRLLNPFVVVLTTILSLAYTYAVWRLVAAPLARIVVAIPFIAVWLVPVLYWVGGREERKHNLFDQVLHILAYVSMGWLSFVLVLSLLRETVQGIASLSDVGRLLHLLQEQGGIIVLVLACVGLISGFIWAVRGPKVVAVNVPLAQVEPKLNGFRIVQISDLHVGMMIRKAYVESVVEKVRALRPDVIVLTGDIVDGPIKEYQTQAMPLAALTSIAPCYYITGNHEYYADGLAWVEYFKQSGLTVLDNDHVVLQHNGVDVLLAGVPDPAVRMVKENAAPDCDLAMATLQSGSSKARAVTPPLRILLAHNPKLAAAAERAGFNLQLSGHTHAGQFFPWTLVTRMVHAPHFYGLSRRKQLWVYVSAGTGTWGPPVRFGTKPELTYLSVTL